LSVAAFGLNNTPCAHVWNYFRKDTIVGYGKLRVYTPSGPSEAYDVLMDKIAEYTTDSFYVGGAPAPATLLTAFNVTQNQQTDNNYRYNFYRKSSFLYLCSYTWPGNGFTGNPNFIIWDTLNVAPLGINEINHHAAYTSVVYPNPATIGNEINIQLVGKTVTNATLQLLDLQGRMVVQENNVAMTNGLLQLKLRASMLQGNYTLRILDEKNQPIVSELITVNKN
jgi:hypothetical protein